MNIINLLKNKNIDKFIIGDEINLDLDIEKYEKIEDVRSAAFYAFGESKIKNEPVVLILNGDYLSSIYTVLTEAWFQKTNLIVVAIYNTIYEIETHYLNRCLVSNIKFFEEDFSKFEEEIESSLDLIGPKLFNVVIETKEQYNNYDNILSVLNDSVKEKKCVYLYNTNKEYNEFPNMKCIKIEEKYKYGIISKYCAMITESNNKILICDSNCLKVDSNIFNNRYINKNFKVIVLDKENKNNYKEWISSNNIKVIESENLKNNINLFLDESDPTVLIVKEDI